MARPPHGLTPPAAAATLEERYAATRARSLRLAALLADADRAARPLPGTRSLGWHLAHATRAFEAGVLEATIPGYRAWDAAYAILFDGCGDAAPAAAGDARPLAGILDYRRHVDARLSALMTAGAPAQAAPLEYGIRHELRHQERLLTDLKQRLAVARAPACAAPAVAPAAALPPPAWQRLPGGAAIALQPVTGGAYAQFIAAGGYARRDLWSPAGWAARAGRDWQAPRYWRRAGDGWRVYTLHGEQPLAAAAPVCHVSCHEAAAYARWAGARLPTAQEWQALAATQRDDGHFAGEHCFEPRAIAGATQVFGGVWEWTTEPAAGATGAVGFVLRGGSCVTPHALAADRLCLPAHARDRFSGLRLVRDGG